MEWILFYLILLIFIYLDIKLNKLWTYLIIILLLLTLGFRYKVGWDYDSYVNIYNSNFLNERLEVGFNFYLKYLKYFKFDSQFLFFSISSLLILSIGILASSFCKKYRALSLLLYCNFYFCMNRYLSNLRQSLSLSIFIFFIYLYLVKNKKNKFFLLSQIGYLFHKSYIFSNFFIFISKIKIINNRKNKKKIIIISLALFFFMESIISNLISLGFSFKYLDDYFITRNFFSIKTEKIPMLTTMLILIFFLISLNDFFQEKAEKLKIFYNICFVATIVFISLINLPKPFLRATDYGTILIIFLIPRYLLIIKNKRKKISKRLLKVVVVYSLIFISSLTFMYEFVITGKDSNNSLLNRRLKYNIKIFKE